MTITTRIRPRAAAKAPVENPHRIEELEKALENVQAARPIAMEVLRLADDPDADARRIAACIEKDPILAAQVLRTANSAAFGMASQVKATQIAVAILGFSTIKSIAILVASGLRNLKNPAPANFWEHSASVAAACSVIGRRFQVNPGDGFALGLIHDIGIPMLNTVDPVTYGRITEEASDDADTSMAETLEFGMSHAVAAATVLGNWSFPAPLVTAIRGHHDAVLPETPEAQLLAAGDALAHLANGEGGDADRARLATLGFEANEIDRIVGDLGGTSKSVLATLLRR